MTQLLISEDINDYAERFTTPEDENLSKLNRETNMKVELPVMLSGHLQGAVLEMISRMISPKRILEIGTYTGYSAICMAKGLTEDGILHTIDVNEELYDMCNEYISKAGLTDKIKLHTGKAEDIIPKIEDVFDLVFIDADKVNYSKYYDQVFDKVKIGGYILADNVLYNGEVTEQETDMGKNAKAIHAYNNKIKEDSRVEQVLLPVRDGIMIARKVAD